MVRTLRLPRIEDPDELDAAVRFRAQDEIPMPLDQAVLDHRVIGRGESADGNPQIDVLAVAARRDMIHPLVQAMRDAGLNPAGIDLSAFGMIRALGPANGARRSTSPASCPFPPRSTPTSATSPTSPSHGAAAASSPASAPSASRRSPTALASREGISLDEARELLMEVGLEEELDFFDR